MLLPQTLVFAGGGILSEDLYENGPDEVPAPP